MFKNDLQQVLALRAPVGAGGLLRSIARFLPSDCIKVKKPIGNTNRFYLRPKKKIL